MQLDNERRKSARIQCDKPILHNTCPPDFFYRGTMYNFSREGLYFESDEDLLQGDEISISIKDPPPPFLGKTGQYFEVRIMWCKLLQGSEYQLGYGARLKVK